LLGAGVAPHLIPLCLAWSLSQEAHTTNYFLARPLFLFKTCLIKNMSGPGSIMPTFIIHFRLLNNSDLVFFFYSATDTKFNYIFLLLLITSPKLLHLIGFCNRKKICISILLEKQSSPPKKWKLLNIKYGIIYKKKLGDFKINILVITDMELQVKSHDIFYERSLSRHIGLFNYFAINKVMCMLGSQN